MTKRSPMPIDVKHAIESKATEYIDQAYRRFQTGGIKEPCLSVGEITDYLRQAHMPTDFRFSTKARQRSWTRSVLESMRRRGKLGSSISRFRCYEPAPKK